MTHLLGKTLPPFTGIAVQDGEFLKDFSLERYKGEFFVLFFYPWDFSFICPKELNHFQERLAAFEQEGVKLVACSSNDRYNIKALMKLAKEEGGIKGLSYPVIADENLEISRRFDCLNEEEKMAYRALFFVDDKGIVRHVSLNDIGWERNPDEVLRMILSWKKQQNCWKTS